MTERITHVGHMDRFEEQNGEFCIRQRLVAHDASPVAWAIATNLMQPSFLAGRHPPGGAWHHIFD